MKVCSLYGAGFYYIPGTDICMKVGGYVRFQQSYGASTSITAGPVGTSNGFNREHTPEYQYRARAIATFDTRQQTAYGTLRTYLILGFTQDSVANTANPGADANGTTLYATRAFIQIAGFTFGKATSFFDFVSTAAVAYNAGHTYSPDTGDLGHTVAAYTAQFGNGMSATLSVEQDRRRGTNYLGSAIAGGGGAQIANADLGGTAALQDIVANLRVDQAWGSAQIAAAVRPMSASYYGAGNQSSALVEWNGHPGEEYGWAVTAGVRLNAPMIGPGDYFQIAGVYAEGATRYASNTPTTALLSQGRTVAQVIHDDGGFSGTAAAPGLFERTTAWSIFASYEHFWTPSLRTSVYGSYLNISRPDNLNTAMCASGLFNNGAAAAGGRAAGCDLDSSQWNIGTRSQWNITKDLYVGVDFIYHKVNTATFNAAGTANLSAGALPGKAASATYTTGDIDAFVTTWRIHRDIVP
ncbi:MAG: porin [Xanthobacteraceae bacterium]|nr:porin [Xanthobacteraceae bacterium]